MKNIVPTIAAIQDISGYGRCSVTVALPILSALGCQVCPLPTAILSNHSGYENFYFFDYTDYIKDYYHQWKKNQFMFDCIYSGFLGSQKQIDLIIDIIKDMKESNNTMVVVDPVMGDHGKVYSTYTKEMIDKMALLVHHADIITPNMTEVSILLGIEYSEDKLSIDTIRDYTKRLSALGPKAVLITGIELEDGKHVNVCYDKAEDEFYIIPYKNINTKYPGTGDLFASLFIGYLYRGLKLPEAVESASIFVSEAVRITAEHDTDKNNGVAFELIMNKLYEPVKEYSYTNI